jgi:hypothetical protein
LVVSYALVIIDIGQKSNPNPVKIKRISENVQIPSEALTRRFPRVLIFSAAIVLTK